MQTVTYACLSDRGRTHRCNEDRWFADPSAGIFLVTDGMAVERPAQLVVDLLPGLIRHRLGGNSNLADEHASQAVRSAIAEVSERIHAAALEQSDVVWVGLGATIVLALVRWPHALLAHLGDSRIYLLRERRLEALTRDHSYVEELVGKGEMAREEVDRLAFNGGPTRFAGMADEAIADTRVVEMQQGDRLLLCSDGLPGMLDDIAIERILNEHVNAEAACRALVDAANDAGGEDNITVLLIEAGS
jgi:PPM family protein phosphatase